MAIPWLAVLQNVPWTEVLRNAPKVADGARKLWRSVARREGATDAAGVVPATSPQVPATPLDQRLARMDATVAELHAQMLASSELIQALADQNTQLVAHMQAAQTRLRRLTVLTIVLAFAVASLAWYR